eukprot:CAMPEP_0175625248 /NCGR_PEP_ID=MMETSP0096-20121207/70370_1 /TAXON_ID=311494 /ORGANISM="Alexandrium monilatum, Strain CCMP3105" /LENGTH=438 /DNA_ID=CAMNT_0016930577 /DNA_START=149 /DNA_END=1462 /DNA_ORIENTATION=+
MSWILTPSSCASGASSISRTSPSGPNEPPAAAAAASRAAGTLVEQQDLVRVGDAVPEMLAKGLGVQDVEACVLDAQPHQRQRGDLQPGRTSRRQLSLPPVHLFLTLCDHSVNLACEGIPDGLGVCAQQPQIRQGEVTDHQWPHGPERHGRAAEAVRPNVYHDDVLDLRLPHRQRCRHRGARLHDVELAHRTLLWVDVAIVLMAPDDKVQEVGQHLLMNGGLVGHTALVALVPVLMQDHDVEPVLRVRGRLEADLSGLEGPVEPLVADVPQAVNRQLRPPLPHEHGSHDDVLEVLRAAKVVHEAGHLQEVSRTEVALTARIVMVAVDHEEGDLHVGVDVLVVDKAAGEEGWIADHLEHDLTGAKAVAPQQLHGAVEGAPARLVFVEEVPAMEDEVGLLGPGGLKDLLEGVHRIAAADLVLLAVANMCVSGNQDAEGVFV